MKLVLAIALTSISTISIAAPTFHVPEEARKEGRYLEVIDVITDSLIEAVAKPIHKIKDNAVVYVLINSPGGSVSSGLTVMDAMSVAQDRGIRFKCLTGVMAASMAFAILAQCDERYTLPGTRLMFHPISTSGRERTRVLVVTKAAVVEVEDRLMRFLQKALGMAWKEFEANYMAETVWTGSIIAKHAPYFISPVVSVRGVPNLFFTGKPAIYNLFQEADIQQAYEIKDKLIGASNYDYDN